MSLTTVDNKTKVPLQSVTVDATCIDNFARVQVSQHFRNDGEKSIEAVYRFPLDEQSAVCGFEANIDGKTIVAECQSKEKAFETYDKAISQGHGAYLAEEERGDVFTISVGNLPANKDVVVKLIYLTKLVPEGDDLRFSIPATIGERYTPATSSSSSSSSKDREMDSSDTAVVAPPTSSSAKYVLEVTLHMKMTAALKSVTSPTHPISFELGEEQGTGTVTLSQDTLMNNDVVFVIATRDPHRPTACCEISRDDKEGADQRTTAMMSIFPSFDTGHLTAESGEIVFLVDRSGSMGGSKMEQCKTALQLFLRSLPEGAKFNIVSFGSTHRSLFSDGPRPLGDDTLDAAAEHVSSMSANMGGTEILRPITDIVAEAKKRRDVSKSSKGSKQKKAGGFLSGFFRRRRSSAADNDDHDGDATVSGGGDADGESAAKTQVLVLTDGQVSNTQSVLREVAKATDDGICRFFSLGIGSGASEELVAGIARNGRGVAEFVADGEGKMHAKVMRQVRRATVPALEVPKVTWLRNGNEIEKDAIVQCPETLPPVFSMDRFTAFATFGKSSKGKVNDVIVPDAARLTGKTPDGSMMTVTVNIPEEAVREGSTLAKLAARETIRFLQDRRGDTARDEITSLALAHNLASRHTSFVAVEKRSEEAKVDSSDMELVVVPQVARKEKPRHSGMHFGAMTKCMARPMATCGAAPPAGGFAKRKKMKGAARPMPKQRAQPRSEIAVDNIAFNGFLMQSAAPGGGGGGGAGPVGGAPPPPAPAACAAPACAPAFGFMAMDEDENDDDGLHLISNSDDDSESDDEGSRGEMEIQGRKREMEEEAKEEEEEEEEKAMSTAVVAPTLPHRPDALIALQKANGRWIGSQSIEAATAVVGFSIASTELDWSQQTADIWATAIALAVLEIEYTAMKEEWDMLASKAKKWLQNNSNADVALLLATAAKIVKSKGSITVKAATENIEI